MNSESFIQSELAKNELNQLEMQVENLKEQKYSELLRENKQLKEKLDKYENPKDMTLMMMWCTEKVKDENKQLKGNWNKLKEWLNSFHKLSEFEQWEMVNKMQEIEQGSDK